MGTAIQIEMETTQHARRRVLGESLLAQYTPNNPVQDLWNARADMPMGRRQPSTSHQANVPGPSSRSSESSDAGEFSALRPASAPPTDAGTFSLAGGVPVPTFESLDQRYLLPLFSNPVASRNFHARKAAYRRSVLNLSGERDIGEGPEDEGDGNGGGTSGRGTPELVRDLRRSSAPGTPQANSPRFAATRVLGGLSRSSTGGGSAGPEGSEDARGTARR